MHSSLRTAGWRTTEDLAPEGPEAEAPEPVHSLCLWACPYQFCWWALDCSLFQHSPCWAMSLPCPLLGRKSR